MNPVSASFPSVTTVGLKGLPFYPPRSVSFLLDSLDLESRIVDPCVEVKTLSPNRLSDSFPIREATFTRKASRLAIRVLSQNEELVVRRQPPVEERFDQVINDCFKRRLFLAEMLPTTKKQLIIKQQQLITDQKKLIIDAIQQDDLPRFKILKEWGRSEVWTEDFLISAIWIAFEFGSEDCLKHLISQAVARGCKFRDWDCIALQSQLQNTLVRGANLWPLMKEYLRFSRSL